MFSLMVIHVVPAVRGAHSMLVLVAGLACMAAGFLSARRGLTPFRELREQLAAVRSAGQGHVLGVYPTEIRPLIDELNGLIENREQSIRRAIATAGDLAHGLKTPLALLGQEADRLSSTGNRETAEAIQQQVDKMSRQIDYHLARARATSSSASGSARSSVAVSAEGLIRTLRKLYASRVPEITSSVDPRHVVRVRREDLDEILGNLLDNACKWATSRISLATSHSAGFLRVTVDDDGPGLAVELRRAVLERGVRADQTAPGSGLGLAIVRDLAELYGGSVVLEASPLGGLRACLTLPAA
ncbi:MAG: sensor histidine kinase [Bryobacteraceae bacterium]|nr:sensor histidine kinase [Bryobacteraceae bacterium]